MSDPAIEHAIAYLRGHTKADLEFDVHLRPIRYVVGPDGRAVAPVMVAMLEAIDGTLYIPASDRVEFEAQVTLEKLDERGNDGALTDRWRIYHGEPEDVNWAHVWIEAARYDGRVIDGEALRQPNPLAGDEAAICKAWNHGRDGDLRTLAERYANVTIEQPVMVGVDAHGIDVRARFDVVRVPFPEAIQRASEVEPTLRAMLERAGST